MDAEVLGRARPAAAGVVAAGWALAGTWLATTHCWCPYWYIMFCEFCLAGGFLEQSRASAPPLCSCGFCWRCCSGTAMMLGSVSVALVSSDRIDCSDACQPTLPSHPGFTEFTGFVKPPLAGAPRWFMFASPLDVVLWLGSGSEPQRLTPFRFGACAIGRGGSIVALVNAGSAGLKQAIGCCLCCSIELKLSWNGRLGSGEVGVTTSCFTSGGNGVSKLPVVQDNRGGRLAVRLSELCCCCCCCCGCCTAGAITLLWFNSSSSSSTKSTMSLSSAALSADLGNLCAPAPTRVTPPQEPSPLIPAALASICTLLALLPGGPNLHEAEPPNGSLAERFSCLLTAPSIRELPRQLPLLTAVGEVASSLARPKLPSSTTVVDDEEGMMPNPGWILTESASPL